jgi:hypothetical protein
MMLLIIWKVYWENNLNEEQLNLENCYESIYKIEKENIKDIKNIKIETINQNDIKIVQSNILIPYEISSKIEKNILYKNNFWIYINESNDNNLETFSTFDTLEWKEMILELDEKTIWNNFDFILEYESNHYLLELEISLDWENFTKTDKENITNFDFKFIKLIATCEKFSCIREKIKIFELNIIKKYYEIYFDNIDNKEIKIYKNYICENNEIDFLNEKNIKSNLDEENIENKNELETTDNNIEINYIKIDKLKKEKNILEDETSILENEILEEKIIENEENLESYNLEIEILEEEIEKIKKINQLFSDEIVLKNRKNNIYMNIVIFLLIIWTWYGLYYYSNKNNSLFKTK